MDLSTVCIPVGTRARVVKANLANLHAGTNTSLRRSLRQVCARAPSSPVGAWAYGFYPTKQGRRAHGCLRQAAFPLSRLPQWCTCGAVRRPHLALFRVQQLKHAHAGLQQGMRSCVPRLHFPCAPGFSIS